MVRKLVERMTGLRADSQRLLECFSIKLKLRFIAEYVSSNGPI